MQRTLKYPSSTLDWSSGAGAKWRWNRANAGINPEGPHGGRLAIKNIRAMITTNITVATAALLGENRYRMARTITVKQRNQGQRFSEVPGDCLRPMLYQLLGASKVREHADVAVGTATVTTVVNIPFERTYCDDVDQNGNPGAYYLPADELELVEIANPIATDFSLGTSTVTINSGSAYLVFECVEEGTREKPDIRQHATDEIYVQDFQATTEGTLNTSGRLQDLLLMCRGDNGGLDLSAIETAQIVVPTGIADQLNVNPDLIEHYASERNVALSSAATKGASVTADPFVASTTRAIAVVLATETAPWEQPETDSVLVKVTETSSPGTLTMVARTVKPRSARAAGAIARTYGKTGAKFSVMTDNMVRLDKDQLRYAPVRIDA